MEDEFLYGKQTTTEMNPVTEEYEIQISRLEGNEESLRLVHLGSKHSVYVLVKAGEKVLEKRNKAFYTLQHGL